MPFTDQLAGKTPQEAESFVRDVLRAHKDSDGFQALNLYLSGLQALYSHIAFTPATAADTRSFCTGGLAAIDAIRNTLQIAYASSPVAKEPETDLSDTEDNKAADLADQEIVY